MHPAFALAVAALCAIPARAGSGAAEDGGAVAGARVAAQRWRERENWPATAAADARAFLSVPVNIVRLYSDENGAESIAPRNWLNAQIEVANRLFRFPDQEMARFGPGDPAPCLQLEVNQVVDVHEREASDVLGREVDSERILLDAGRSNGAARAGTWDLRSLKVTGEEDVLTVFYVHDMAEEDGGQRVGIVFGESNLGFADQPSPVSRYRLVKVSGTRAEMGVVMNRQEAGTRMRTLAHELGHYFGLYHAWERAANEGMGIRDLGYGPQGDVDGEPGSANVMDYDHGAAHLRPEIEYYLSATQIAALFQFARDKASTQIRVRRGQGGGSSEPPPVAAEPAAEFLEVRAEVRAGEIALHAKLAVHHLQGRTARVIAWFYDQSGERLLDADGEFTTSNGQVATERKVEPRYDKSLWEDLELVLPADQLHLPAGSHELQAVLAVHSGGKFLERSRPVTFRQRVAGGGGPDDPGEDPGGVPPAWGRIQSWDVDVVERGGEPWVRVDAECELQFMEGRALRLEARFAFDSGKPIRDLDGSYGSPDGLAFTSLDLRARAARDVLNEVLWIPLAQLHLAPGAHRVRTRLALVDGGRAIDSFVTKAVRMTVAGGGGAGRGAARAELFDARVTQGHEFRGERCLAVHTGLELSGFEGREVVVAARLWGYQGRWKTLPDRDGRFGQDGCVISRRPIRPRVDDLLEPDFLIYVPYEELHLWPGEHDLGVDLVVEVGGREVARSPGIVPFGLRVH